MVLARDHAIEAVLGEVLRPVVQAHVVQSAVVVVEQVAELALAGIRLRGDQVLTLDLALQVEGQAPIRDEAVVVAVTRSEWLRTLVLDCGAGWSRMIWGCRTTGRSYL